MSMTHSRAAAHHQADQADQAVGRSPLNDKPKRHDLAVVTAPTAAAAPLPPQRALAKTFTRACTRPPGLHLNDREFQVLSILWQLGPMTTHKIALALGLSVVSVSPRIKPLRDRDLVRATGEHELGRTVWEACGLG